MSRKSKIDSAEKVKIVERLLADETSVSEAARLTGVDKASIRRWRNLYLADGSTALMAQRNNKVYSQELKLQAVHEYLDSCRMDYVDLYIYHMWDWNTDLYDIMEGLNRIVKAGKARYIGISNCFAWQIAKANAIAETKRRKRTKPPEICRFGCRHSKKRNNPLVKLS